MFRTVTENGIEYVSSDVLPVKNAFSTRIGGVSRGDFSSLNFGSARGDAPEAVRENYRRFCALFGAGEDEACITKQVHENVVRKVSSADRHISMTKLPYEADGVATADKNQLIMCFTADCVPVLLADKSKKACAAVHCGWKGSVKDILGETIKAMNELGADTKEICAALGPAIGRDCFETHIDVPEAICAYLGLDMEELRERKVIRRIKSEDEKFLVDLRLANKIRLMQLGVPERNIDVSEDCTMSMPEKYYSNRYCIKRNIDRGSLANAIML